MRLILHIYQGNAYYHIEGDINQGHAIEASHADVRLTAKCDKSDIFLHPAGWPLKHQTRNVLDMARQLRFQPARGNALSVRGLPCRLLAIFLPDSQLIRSAYLYLAGAHFGHDVEILSNSHHAYPHSS